MSKAALLAVFCIVLASTLAKTYEPNWPSLDSRPNPSWWNNAKFSIFMCWGLYSVPSYCGPYSEPNHLCYAEWYWYDLHSNDSNVTPFHDRTYGKDFKYQDFADEFKAELFDPDEWAALFKKSGAKAVVITTKHHDGWTLWPSAQSWNWNAVDTGPHRDLIGDLSASVRNAGLRMGYYYSLFEWFNPLFIGPNPSSYVDQVMLPQLKDLVTTYKPSVLYTDGEWMKSSDFWKTKPFLAWLFNDSPVKDEIAINDRWGNETRGKHGGFYVCEYSAFKGCPPHGSTKHPWTAHRGMGGSFGYNRIDQYSKPDYFIHLLVDSIAYGGHLQINVGPAHDGRIDNAQKYILTEIGDWMEVNSEGIYDSTVWRVPEDPVRNGTLYYTQLGDAVYAYTTVWPGKTLMFSGIEVTGSGTIAVEMLGVKQSINVYAKEGKLVIDVPQLTPDEVPCKYAWGFKITGAFA